MQVFNSCLRGEVSNRRFHRGKPTETNKPFMGRRGRRLFFDKKTVFREVEWSRIRWTVESWFGGNPNSCGGFLRFIVTIKK